MHALALSEVFGEVVEAFVEVKGYLLLQLRETLPSERARLYAEKIHAAEAPLNRCVAIIDCTKIKMNRPKGQGSMQRSGYSGQKRFHCLIYQTVTTADGLIFSWYGPDVGRRHKLTLLPKSGLETQL